MARHVRRRRGRHVKRPVPYQGWGQPDEADQLLAAQVRSGHTPPMGFPAYVPPPRQGWPLHVRLALAAGLCMFSLVIGAAMILAVAFVMGAPPPADAEADQSTVEIVVKDSKVKVKDGTYTLERKP